MEKIFDLPAEANNLFPSHGWIENCDGFKVLRFPILQLFRPEHYLYARYQAHGLAEEWLDIRSPRRILRKLSVALRDLHFEIRQLPELTNQVWHGQANDRGSALTRQQERVERCEVLLVSILTLLRRLADDIVEVLRPVLFEHWRSAPIKLKSLVDYARKGCLHTLSPLYDATELSAQLITNSTWLDRLRKEDGIRDILVHRPHYLDIVIGGSHLADSEKIEWNVIAVMKTSTANGIESKNLFPIIIECIAGACKLMNGISGLIDGMDSYNRNDWLFLTGADNDIVGFWPDIKGRHHEFPLM